MNISYSHIVPKSDELVCIIDNQTFKNATNRNKYIKTVHNLTYEQYIMKYYFNDIYPTCKCGCGNIMPFVDSPFGIWFNDYTRNHFPRKPHTEETKEKIIRRTKEAVKEKYGVDNYYKTEEFQIKAKKTRLEKYGDENYNNPEKNKVTNMKRYGVTNPIYFAVKKKNKSKQEIEICEFLNLTSKFIFNHKEYDMYLNNEIFETESIYYHPKVIQNLDFTQIGNIFNDKIKYDQLQNTEYILYKVQYQDLPKNINDLTLDKLRNAAYIPNYKIEYDTIIVSKESIKRYLNSKGEKKLNRYIPLLCNFINEFFPNEYSSTQLKSSVKYIIGFNDKNEIFDFSMNNVIRFIDT